MEKSGKENITLNEELDLVTTYFKLENSRMNIPVQQELNVDDELDADQLLAPTLITQPFIENAFKHAFEQEKKDKKISLSVKSSEHGFQITIQDNGVGFAKKEGVEASDHHHSFALGAMEKDLERSIRETNTLLIMISIVKLEKEQR